MTVMDTFHRCWLLPVGQVDTCADDRCSSGNVVSCVYQRRAATAITDGGDAVWYMNPTALLMNDAAVAGLTESVPMLLLATAKLYLCTSKCYYR